MGAVAIQSEAEWHQCRETNVGGSEIASLFYRWACPDGSEVVLHMFEPAPEGATVLDCLSPYKTGYRLWQEKAGKLMPDSLEEVERIQAGLFMEPAIAAWANNRWPDFNLRKVRRYITHETVEGWGVSLDYEVHGPGMPPVELKNVDGLVFRDQWGGKDDDLTPPLHINLQLQSQIGAKGSACGWFVASVGGNRLMRCRVERHEPTQERIAEAITAFWKSIKAGVEPWWLCDFETVRKLHAEGLEVNPPAGLEITDTAFATEAAEFLAAKAALDAAEDRYEDAKARVARRLGEATRGYGAGYRVTWPAVRREAKLIPAKQQAAMSYRGALTVRAVA